MSTYNRRPCDDTTDEILMRLRRMETRHVKLMLHLGLDESGHPQPEVRDTPTQPTKEEPTT